MKHTNRLILFVLSIFSFFSIFAEAADPIYSPKYAYELIDIGTLDGDVIMPRDINNNGTIVGYTYETYTGFIPKAVIWENGIATQLDDAGCMAYGINDSRQIVGRRPHTFNSYNRAVVWEPSGTRHDLPVLPGCRNSWAKKISNSGNIIGHMYTTSFESQGLYWEKWYGYNYHDPEIITVAETSDNINAQAINDNGRVIGDYIEVISLSPYEIRTSAFVWENGSGVNVLEIEREFSMANGINNENIIVGRLSEDPVNYNKAFVHDAGTTYLVGFLPNGTSSHAMAINDENLIVGSATINGENNPRAFLRFPEGAMFNLNDLIPPYSNSSFTLTHAMDINNNLWIIGSSETYSQTRYFLLRPKAFLSGDLDGDDDVDGTDLNRFLTKYHNNDPIADLNNDGVSNDQDLADFANNFGL